MVAPNREPGKGNLAHPASTLREQSKCSHNLTPHPLPCSLRPSIVVSRRPKSAPRLGLGSLRKMSEKPTGEGIGQALPRQEDLRLLRGRGRYAADITMPNIAFAAMV